MQMHVTVSGAGEQSKYVTRSYSPESLSRTSHPGQILGAAQLVDNIALASYLGGCQFKFGGIAKAPGEHAGVFFVFVYREHIPINFFPDPYHTYLSLAAIAMFPPPESEGGGTWAIEPLDPLINAKSSTAQWARAHIPSKSA
jgi:geranylgeranyl transferase type-1 subunit beta